MENLVEVSTENTVKKWYVLHTYSGYENSVKDSLDKKIKFLGIKDKIPRVLVPEEEIVEIKGKRKKRNLKKIFPGYVLIEIVVEQLEGVSGTEYKIPISIWETIRNTQGVSGFVFSGSYPAPLSENEVYRVLKRANLSEDGTSTQEKPLVEINFKVDEKIKIVGGPFAGSLGVINEINYETLKIKTMIEIFSRMTPVEVDVREIEKL